MLPSESPIFAEQDDYSVYTYIYIFFFTAYGWPVRLEIQTPFFLAQKVLVGLRVRLIHIPDSI